MERETVKISSLKAAPYNPRRISKEAADGLTRSLERWGVVQEVVANRRTGHIVGGHQRVAALRKMGVKEVPVVWVDLDEVEEKALNVALNNPHISGEFDDTLSGLLAEIRDGVGPDDFAELKLDELLPPDAEVVEGNTDPDDVPEAPEEPITKPGDLWILGNHRLLCGDSTNIQHVERLMGGENADMVFTDPPYGVEYRSNMSKRFEQIKNDDTILEVAPVIYQFLANDSAAFVWTSHHVYPIWRQQFESFYKQTIIWSKGGGGMGDLEGQYALDYEMALFCTKGSPKFRAKRGMAVWDIGKDRASDYVHPTQKPVSLAEQALSDFTSKGQKVLDLFGGSGSTLIACERQHRHARLMELDPAYCDVIVKRWEDFTGKKATLEAKDATG